jgi:hypothetical protein
MPKFQRICLLALAMLVMSSFGSVFAQDADLERRIDELESKLDAILDLLEKNNRTDATPRVPDVIQRKIDMPDVEPRPYLGVQLEDNDEGEAIVISVVPESSAHKAGLKVDDVILKVGDDKVEGYQHLIDLVQRRTVGETIQMVVRRADGELLLTAELGSRGGIDSDPIVIEIEPGQKMIERRFEDGENHEFGNDTDPTGEKQSRGEWKSKDGTTMLKWRMDGPMEIQPGIFTMAAGGDATLVLNPDGSITVKVTSVERSDDGVRIKTEELTADSIEAFKAEHPELAKKYGIGERPLEFKLLGAGTAYHMFRALDEVEPGFGMARRILEREMDPAPAQQDPMDFTERIRPRNEEPSTREILELLRQMLEQQQKIVDQLNK